MLCCENVAFFTTLRSSNTCLLSSSGDDVARRASDLREVEFGDYADQCGRCQRYHRRGRGDPTCDAFPNGIPDELRFGLADHRVSYDGDNGLTFEGADPDVLSREFWDLVASKGLPRFRCLRSPLTAVEVD